MMRLTLLCTTNVQDIEFVLHLSGGFLCKLRDDNGLTDDAGGAISRPLAAARWRRVLDTQRCLLWLRPKAALGSLWADSDRLGFSLRLFQAGEFGVVESKKVAGAAGEGQVEGAVVEGDLFHRAGLPREAPDG